MATEEDTAHPPEIAIHICPHCRKDIASGLDAKGFPARCRACSRKPRTRSARPQSVERIKALERQLKAVSFGLDYVLCPICRKEITLGLDAKANPTKCQTCSRKDQENRKASARQRRQP